MNSLGPVSLVYEAIYKLLHYINWFSNDDRDSSIAIESIPTHIDKMNEMNESESSRLSSGQTQSITNLNPKPWC